MPRAITPSATRPVRLRIPIHTLFGQTHPAAASPPPEVSHTPTAAITATCAVPATPSETTIRPNEATGEERLASTLHLTGGQMLDQWAPWIEINVG